ncbi:MAG: D-cysteine desulfhydrase family protein [Planctomycetota bacterium]
MERRVTGSAEPKRVELARLPTPLVRLERLGRVLAGAVAGPAGSGRPEIWVKRDDLTGLELSGNKVRKLEYVAADALATGCDTLVTEGTPQSNHCRATAAVCARLGLRCVLLFRPSPPAGPALGNHMLDQLFGAEVRAYPRAEYEQRHNEIVADVLAELRAAGRTPRWTPAGASEPLGCWGYIRAMAELGEQLRTAGIGECDLVLAISSGGTCAGAVLGRVQHGLDRVRLWAVPVSDDVAHHRANTAHLCRAAIEQYRLAISFDPDTLTGTSAAPAIPAQPTANSKGLEFIDGYVGAGYAVPYAAELDGIRLLAQTEALLLDPVYTGKAFRALLDGVRAGRFGWDRPVVFLHTGGVFSDFAWPELF